MRLFSTRHSHAELYVHAVWTTKHRAAVLSLAVLASLSRQARETAHVLGAEVLAFWGVSEHVHVLLRYRPDLSVSQLVRGIKAALTRTVRREVSELPDFEWQTGFGAFSVSASDVHHVSAYISNQEHHHAVGSLWPGVELGT